MVLSVSSSQDGSAYAQNIDSFTNSMNVSGKTTASGSRKVSQLKEDSFDSGILSEGYVSSNLSLEIESLDYKINNQMTLESVNFEEYQNNCEKHLAEMGLSSTDSGIYVDLSGNQLSNSKEASKLSSKSVNCTKLDQFLEMNEDGNTKLHLAILDRDENSVKYILRLIPNSIYLNIRNYYCQTSLHLAVLMNLPEITRLLFLAGARADIEDRNGNTALHLACKINHVNCVKALLKPLTPNEVKHTQISYRPIIQNSQLYLNEYNYDGLSCLHIAAAHENYAIMNLLLIYGADINIGECKGGYTVLHEAVISGQENLVKYILKHPGIDVNRETYARRSAFQLSSNNDKIKQILLDNGCEFSVFENSDNEISDNESFYEEY